MNSAGWEKNIRIVKPYTPGEQPGGKDIIKLNTNENPYDPSPEVIKLMEELDASDFKKYPDPAATELVSAIADYHKVTSDRVFVGVGSDDVLGMCFMTFFNSEFPVLFPDITYSFYPVWAELLRVPYETCSLDKESFNIKRGDYIGHPNGGIVIPNPNAPTSILMRTSDIEEIVKNNSSSIVIIDEAYIDFAPEGSSVLPLTDKYDNLIVIRTYSKSRSMAGIRIGYAIASPKIIKYLNDVKYSYNSYTMNIPSIKLGAAALKNEEYFRNTVKNICDTREWFIEELKKLGFRVLPSSANFVFASPQNMSAEELFQLAREEKIYFRYFSDEKIKDFLRITIGKQSEMMKVIQFFMQEFDIKFKY